MENRNFQRNNLGRALSPYLRQHSENPVWWQEWSREVLEYAAGEDKPLFVSVGYSTCHWCHVMAGEAFSDRTCADLLNRYFVAIKVDREERPDIDQFLMEFLMASTGRGGWPLNAFLSPELKPFFAMTYAPVEASFGISGMGDILKNVVSFYHEKKGFLQVFEPGKGQRREAAPSADFGGEACREIDRTILDLADREHGGIRGEQKFPPHASLLYALHRLVASADSSLTSFVRDTLDVMLRRGLHDHVGGGFFRYCVDKDWRIPHFEKMLYDQALMLWNYSLAGRIFNEAAYRSAAEGVVDCLRENFLEDGLFCAALDADTDHSEGATYLWTGEELRRLLTAPQYRALKDTFELDERGNFEGKIHLVGREIPDRDGEIGDILDILAATRQERSQPFRDRKKLSSWNSLAGIGLLQAERQIGLPRAGDLARSQLETLLELQPEGGAVIHAELDGRVFPGSFLGDHAAMLLLLTFHHEDRRLFRKEIEALRDSVRAFSRDHGWQESAEEDFLRVPAGSFDSPLPSSESLAEYSLARAAMVLGEEYPHIAPGRAFAADFRNLGYLMTSGLFYQVTGPEPVGWSRLPPAAVQGEGDVLQYCHAGACTRGLPSVGETGSLPGG